MYINGYKKCNRPQLSSFHLVNLNKSNTMSQKSLRGVWKLMKQAKFYIPSTLNIDLILWHTQSWVFPFTFQAYILPHKLNVSVLAYSNFIFEF